MPNFVTPTQPGLALNTTVSDTNMTVGGLPLQVDDSYVNSGGDSIVGNTNWWIPGCTDPTALNYDINASVDNGTCQY